MAGTAGLGTEFVLHKYLLNEGACRKQNVVFDEICVWLSVWCSSNPSYRPRRLQGCELRVCGSAALSDTVSLLGILLMQRTQGVFNVSYKFRILSYT